MQYFYLDTTQQPCGPCSLDELRLLAQEGKIPFDTLVAHNGAERWAELSSLCEPQNLSPTPENANEPSETANIPSYLTASILVTILCCMPLGIVSIISSCKVDKLIALGDVEGAKAASKKTSKWIAISIVLGTLILLCITAQLRVHDRY